MEAPKWDDAIYLDAETAALLFAEAEQVVDFPAPETDVLDYPDIHQLFLHYDDLYFGGKLKSVEVKWSARMTLFVPLLL